MCIFLFIGFKIDKENKFSVYAFFYFTKGANVIQMPKGKTLQFIEDNVNDLTHEQ